MRVSSACALLCTFAKLHLLPGPHPAPWATFPGGEGVGTGLQGKICVVVGVLGGGGAGRSGSGGSGGRWGRCRRTGRPSFHRQFSPRTGNRYSSGRSSFGTAWGSSLSLMFAPIIHAFRANCYGTFCEKPAGSPSTAAKTPLPPFPGLACRKRRRRASFPRAAAARR